MRKSAYITGTVIAALLATIGCALRTGSSRESSHVKSSAPASPSILHASTSALRQQASLLYFLGGEIGWAVLGDDLYGTRDGGKTWRALNRSGVPDVRELIFANERDGWAIRDEWGIKRHANFVLRTEDGGRSWREVLMIGSPIYGIVFLNERVGYVTPRWEPIQRTTDGGETWEEILTEPAKSEQSLSLSEGLHEIYFINEKEAWGYGSSIWHTADGGLTWTEVVPDGAIKGGLRSAAFVDEKTGWIVGDRREVWRTTDGRTWQRAASVPPSEGKPSPITKEPPSGLYCVTFIDRHEGWVVADDNTLLHSTDGGVTWQVILRWSRRINSIRFISRHEGWAVDEGDNLLHTTDGGRSWEVQRLL